MQVKIEEIQDRGLELDEIIPRAVLDAAVEGSPGFAIESASPLKASLKRLAGRVLLKGAFDAEVKAPCKRCLCEVRLKLPIRFELNLVPRPERPHDDETSGRGADDAARAGSFRLDEVDSEPFDGKTIQLDPIIREQVLLGLPVSVLCREDCQGLCAVCGQDLNERDCGHERKVVDIRLAKLKDIKLN